MATFEHERLLKALQDADHEPDTPAELAAWLRGTRHLDLLRTDAEDVELVLAALSRPTCINSYVVPEDLPDLEELLNLYEWSPNPYDHNAASYYWSWGTDGVRADSGDTARWGHLPPAVSPLVFFRNAIGVTDEGSISREVAQDYAHASAIHWRPERRAYSRIDFRGDWEDVVSCTTRQESGEAELVSARRESIDLHLIALRAVLVRVFEFHLSRQSLPFSFEFTDEEEERSVRSDADLQYREHVSEKGLSFIRGVQVIRPRLSSFEVEQLVKEGRIPDPSESEPVSFIVEDWRNGRIATVSTDPSTTTNYFTAEGNSLPFEVSPAYFRPDVLLKYKADRDKYAVLDSRIECRGGWMLKTYSVNEAGQIAAYICYLRDLPHEEQQHWASYNERPKAGLSKRTIETDFLGKWPEDLTPREHLVHVLDQWRNREVAWWTWRDETSPELLTAPRTASRDEWGAALVALSNSVIEGFVVKELRHILRGGGEDVDKQWGSIKLLEEILQNRGAPLPKGGLMALREANEGRVLSGVHATGHKGAEFAKSVMQRHGTFASHVEYLYEEVTKELLLIEQVLGE